jgi:phenylacetate-coenzyme A ligase PaaK-like adenylate-forming protein
VTLAFGRVHRDFAAAERRRALTASDPAGLAERQLNALRAIWANAVDDVPYYGSLVGAGQAPRELRSWTDLHAIPVLSRQTLQDQPTAFIRHSRPAPSQVLTGGSTATPIRIGMDREERQLMRIVKLAAWQSLGYTPSARLFLIWGHSHLLGTGWRGRLNHAKRRLADAVLRYRRVDAYRLSPEICQHYAADILRFRPFGIIGYASALDLFARYTQNFRERFHQLGLGFVLSTAEAPPRPDSVDVIEDLFGCPLVQEYGGAEFGQVAFKRGREPFEVYSDLNVMECGADGAALVTALYPRYTPLIRYQIGDALDAPVTMNHGHVLRFGAVAGRVNDMVRMADGASVHSVAVLHCVHQEPAVHNAQLLLDDEGVELRLVADSQGRDVMEQRIRARLSQVHGDLARATVRYVPDIDTTLAGKRRWLVDRRSVKRP